MTMQYADLTEKALKERVLSVAAELRRRGYKGQALYDELERRGRAHRAHLARCAAAEKARPAVVVKAADKPVDRFWTYWNNGGREAAMRECEAAGT